MVMNMSHNGGRCHVMEKDAAAKSGGRVLESHMGHDRDFSATGLKKWDSSTQANWLDQATDQDLSTKRMRHWGRVGGGGKISEL